MRGGIVTRTIPSPGRWLLVLVAAGCFLGPPARADRSPAEGSAQSLSPRQLQDNLAAKTYSGRRIDLVFSKVGLREVVAALEKAGGIPLKLDPSIDDPVTYRMLDVPWDEALAAVIADNELRIDMDLDGTGFKIGRGKLIVLAFPEPGRARIVLFLYRNLVPIGAGIVLLIGLGIVVRSARMRRGSRVRNGKRALLPPEAVERVKTKLVRALREERIYQDEELTLRTLADALEVSPHQLSWIINEEFRVSFPTLVNGYRIEEVKSRLADPSFDGGSILETALDAGFNTKASFNRAFKRHTGMTPSEYKKSLSE
jgi:AraC-like DNA-binding protein